MQMGVMEKEGAVVIGSIKINSNKIIKISSILTLISLLTLLAIKINLPKTKLLLQITTIIMRNPKLTNLKNGITTAGSNVKMKIKNQSNSHNKIMTGNGSNIIKKKITIRRN